MMKIQSLVLSILVTPCFVSAEVSTPKQIADRPSAHCQAPRWAPDGSKIAYDVYNPKQDTREVWIVPTSGGGMEKVTAGRAKASALLGGKAAPIVDFCWAPDMKMLSKPFVFSSRGAKKNFDLFADGSWLTSNPGNDGQPAWSPDGRFIAYTSQRRDSGDIYILDLAGDTDKPKRATEYRNATEYFPRWAPKKNYLLFTRSVSGSKGQDIGVIADVTRAKDTTRMVTSWTGDEIRPSWSPEGTHIAFYSNKGRKNDKIFDLWVISISGQDAKKLATDVVVDDHFGPTWTPDGSTLLYVKRDFKQDNPVKWVKRDGSGDGVLDTGTQLNSDLSLFAAGSTLKLAFKALGQRGSTEKTWERLYVVTFTIDDLKVAAE